MMLPCFSNYYFLNKNSCTKFFNMKKTVVIEIFFFLNFFNFLFLPYFISIYFCLELPTFQVIFVF